MPQPFRIGVMQLTMEPLDEILEHARAMDEGGFDTIWLAEAYPWWRKHSMEARVTQEAVGPGRFYLGLGVSKIFMRHASIDSKPVAAMKEAAEIVRGVLGKEHGQLRIYNPTFEFAR